MFDMSDSVPGLALNFRPQNWQQFCHSSCTDASVVLGIRSCNT